MTHTLLGLAPRLLAASMERAATSHSGQTLARTADSPSQGTEPRVVTETQLIDRHRWRHLTAQIHHEPLCVAPVLVASMPQTQLILQLSGAMSLGVTKGREHRRYQTEPGTLYLTAANRPAYELDWLNVSPDPIRTLHLYLDDDLLVQTAAADAGFDAAQLELREGSCLDDPLLRHLGHALVQEMQSPEARHDLYADTVARMLAAQLVRQHGTVKAHLPEPGGKLPPKQMRQLHDHIRAQLGQPITLDALAALVCLSTYHFCRVFKRTTGLSPNQYVIAQRMAQAAHLLRHTRLTVAHIASEVGYQSVRHFTQLFQRHMGHPPAEYAKRRLLWTQPLPKHRQESAHSAQVPAHLRGSFGGPQVSNCQEQTLSVHSP